MRVSFSPSPSSPHSLPLLGKCFPLTVPLWVASITTLHISPLTDFPSEGRKLSWLAHSSSDRTVRVFATVYPGFNVIGERERANLVVQLALFLYIYIYLSVCHHTEIFYVILNTRQRNFTYTVSRACANIYRFDLTGQLYYSWQVCALLVVGWCCWLAKQPVLQSSSSCSTPSFFAIH